MHWDNSPDAGFTTAPPWIDVNPNHTWLNATAQYRDPGSIYHHYRQLVALRHQVPVIAHGDFTMLLEDSEHVYTYLRSLDLVQLLVVANLSGQERVVLDGLDSAWGTAELLLTNHAGPSLWSRPLRLAAWEARVYRRALVGCAPH